MRCRKSEERQKVKDEIAIMNDLDHAKLLQLAAAYENPREMIMVMEYIGGGELFEKVWIILQKLTHFLNNYTNKRHHSLYRAFH